MSLSEIGFVLIVGIFVMVLLQVLNVLPRRRRSLAKRSPHTGSVKTEILRRIARRCSTRDAPSQKKIRDLETELGLEPSAPSGDLVDQLADPDLVDCGKTWCRKRRA